MQNLLNASYLNAFTRNFPGDESRILQPRQTPDVFYSLVEPTPVAAPRLLAWSEELGAQLGLSRPANAQEVAVLAGNGLAAGMQPYSARYGGHQFGNWAGQLGDGRAITLGELRTPDGSSQELQLKGAGPTPYSRRADGRAVLRSSVREYLMSEAMHHLGVPTTRALSLVATGDQVMRDMFYDGRPAFEPGAIVCRVAPTFLRFGHYEILAVKKEFDNLKMLVDWTIEKYYPQITGADKVLQWFREVLQRTALLMVEWMRVGFVHGVMNTDNMSILGLTIDYGPYSFLDDYDPNFTPNTTDLPGRRYAFTNQPGIGQWNLACLAGALVPLVAEAELEKALKEYEGIFITAYYRMLAQKLGFDALREEDGKLIARFEKNLSSIKPDMTIFYQLLIDVPGSFGSEEEVLRYFEGSFYTKPTKAQLQDLTGLMKLYLERRASNSRTEEETVRAMRAANPRFILRNYLLHQAIEEIQNEGKDTLFRKLEEALRDPYSNRFDEFLQKRPDWAGQKAGCSMLSCSS